MTVDVETYQALFELMPPQLRPFIRDCLEGNVTQFALLWEQGNGEIVSTFPLLEHANAAPNHFAMVGALEMVKRDYMRLFIKSRMEYEPKQ